MDDTSVLAAMRRSLVIRVAGGAALCALAFVCAGARLNANTAVAWGGAGSAQRSAHAAVPATARTPLVYVANSAADSVTAYPGTATGNVRPSITLAGPHTRIVKPVALAHDTAGRLFVACVHFAANTQTGEILVFAKGATGDAAPLRSIAISSYPFNGESAGPVAPVAVAVDWNGYTYVGLAPGGFGIASEAVSVYGPTASGPAAPLRTFDIGAYSSPYVAVNGASQVYVIETPDRFNPAVVDKFSNYADGNVLLGGPLHGPDGFQTNGLAVAPRSGDVYVTNVNGPSRPSILILDPTFTTIIGAFNYSATGPSAPSGTGVDGNGRVYVVTAGNMGPAGIEIFAPGARGNTRPERIISGPQTGLQQPLALTLIE